MDRGIEFRRKKIAIFSALGCVFPFLAKHSREGSKGSGDDATIVVSGVYCVVCFALREKNGVEAEPQSKSQTATTTEETKETDDEDDEF